MNTLYSASNILTVNVTRFFTDDALTFPFNGQSLWWTWYGDIKYAVKINSDGYVIDFESCTTTTTTSTTTKAPVYLYINADGQVSYETSEEACSAEVIPPDGANLFTGDNPIVVGTVFYGDAALSYLFDVQSDSWYKITSTVDLSVKIVHLTASVVTSIATC